jgi:poly(hydroxyalkanoate) granule-associated protein
MRKGRQVKEEVTASAHKIWLAGLGAMAAAGEEGKQMFESLVERGKQFEARSKTQVSKVKGKVSDAKAGLEVMLDRLSGRLDESVASALQRLGVPTRKEIATLTKRVEELTRKLEKAKPTATQRPTRRATPRKPAPAKPAAAGSEVSK